MELFSRRSDIPHPNLYNDSGWIGLVLCASFKVDVNWALVVDILDLETSL